MAPLLAGSHSFHELTAFLEAELLALTIFHDRLRSRCKRINARQIILRQRLIKPRKQLARLERLSDKTWDQVNSTNNVLLRFRQSVEDALGHRIEKLTEFFDWVCNHLTLSSNVPKPIRKRSDVYVAFRQQLSALPA